MSTLTNPFRYRHQSLSRHRRAYSCSLGRGIGVECGGGASTIARNCVGLDFQSNGIVGMVGVQRVSMVWPSALRISNTIPGLCRSMHRCQSSMLIHSLIVYASYLRSSANDSGRLARSALDQLSLKVRMS